MLNKWFAVFPCGDKLDLTASREPAACFKYREHADKYGHRMWPGFYEVEVVQLQLTIQPQTT